MAVIIMTKKKPCKILDSFLIIKGRSFTEEISLISLITPMPFVEFLLEELDAIEEEANSCISSKVVKCCVSCSCFKNVVILLRDGFSMLL